MASQKRNGQSQNNTTFRNKLTKTLNRKQIKLTTNTQKKTKEKRIW